jgi:biopolymer transport protein ExbD
MQIRRRRPEESEELPLTPLIDVVFLLLIFFLTATSFYKKEKDIKVDPPRATEGKASPRRQREITVNIRNEADGGFFIVDGRIVSLPRLNEMLTDGIEKNPRLIVIIRGDKHAYHQKIVDVLNACKKAKVKRYFIATTFDQPQS